MNKDRTLWKLEQINERLWILAAMIAQQAGSFGHDGLGFAVIAEETRKLTEKMQYLTEQALFEGENIKKEEISDIALQLNLLALNSTIQAYLLEFKGRQAAVVCTEEIRKLAYEIVKIFDDKLDERVKQSVNPYPKNPLKTVNQNYSFLMFTVAGVPVKENLGNISDVNGIYVEHTDKTINIRGREFPLVSKSAEPTCYIIMYTIWSNQDKTKSVVVAADSCEGIITCPLGTPVEPPSDMPLAKYVRECWENENGEPFYFMDWTKMV